MITETDFPLRMEHFNKALDSGDPAQYLDLFQKNIEFCRENWSANLRERDSARGTHTRINDRRNELVAERDQLSARHKDAVNAASLARFQDQSWKALYNDAEKLRVELESLDKTIDYSMVTVAPVALRNDRRAVVLELEAKRDANLAVGMFEKLKTISAAIAAGLDAQLDLSESHAQKMIAGSEAIERSELELARKRLAEVTA